MNGFGDEGEFLDGGNNDRYAVAEGGGELLGVFVDFLDDSGFMVKLIDGVLELAIKDGAIGDDDDGVKYFFVLVVMEVSEAVG